MTLELAAIIAVAWFVGALMSLVYVGYEGDCSSTDIFLALIWPATGFCLGVWFPFYGAIRLGRMLRAAHRRA